MDISKFFAKKGDLSHQSNNGEVDNKRNHRLANPKQNKNKPIKLWNFCGTILGGGFFLNKKKLKNTGISTTESLTSKCMELLNSTKEQFGFYTSI